jgi:hypothetical protein
MTRVALFEANLDYVPCLLINFLIDLTQAHHKEAHKVGEFVQQIETCLGIIRE